MGQITIFEKENCEHCERVLRLLEILRENVLKEVINGQGSMKSDFGQNVGCNSITPEIAIVKIDCGKQMGYASFCLRRTGSFSVPHVFFNEEYVGSSDAFQSNSSSKHDELYNKLVELANTPAPLSPFPPPPDASLVKVTDTLAFASQPTENQLKSLYSFGIRSVLNILRPDAPTFVKNERVTIFGADETEGYTRQRDLVYEELPLYSVTCANVLRILGKVKDLPKPILIHDDLGDHSGVIALLAAADEMHRLKPSAPLSEATIHDWARDLFLSMKDFKDILSEVVDAIIKDQK